MTEETEKAAPAAPAGRVNWRRLPLLGLGVLGALFGFYLLMLWLVPAWNGYRVASGRRAELAPLVEKARALDLKYENAAAAGLGGTPVIWCVQNRGEHVVTVDGDPAKPLYVPNYPAMPAYSGSKHQACTPMLLLLENRAPGRPVTVFFKEAL
ncbi:MAG: hypothetical protein A2X32_11420 [Elusimicrobia bacterium GWC2_64_44]|nr:MAG: hypothetical protein A2X32_11420 [Elusimicrobia bacterium GWC2_64_44]